MKDTKQVDQDQLRQTQKQMHVAIRDKLLITIEEFGTLLGYKRTTMYNLDTQGRIPSPIRLTKRDRRWVLAEVAEWVAAGCPRREAWEAKEKQIAGRRGS